MSKDPAQQKIAELQDKVAQLQAGMKQGQALVDGVIEQRNKALNDAVHERATAKVQIEALQRQGQAKDAEIKRLAAELAKAKEAAKPDLPDLGPAVPAANGHAEACPQA